jgi:6-phosphogluconolactonase
MKMKVKVIMAVALAVFLSSPLTGPGTASANSWHYGSPGAVYAMTNAPDDNELIIYSRDGKGLLTPAGSISTGGMGSGGGLDPLGSQSSVICSPNNRWLFAVNAGSNDISVFKVHRTGPVLLETIDSGGDFPVSLTLFHNLLYVLNGGTDPNITGFMVNHEGHLTPLEDSTRDLNDGAFSQVGFGPRGRVLVITDRGNNEIQVFSVTKRGTPGQEPVVSDSEGVAPFGFIFDTWGHPLVSEAGSGAVSSYRIRPDLTLNTITASEANGQNATCWIAGNSRYAFTANTASGTLSSYRVKPWWGSLELIEAVAGTGNLPIDMATTMNGRFLYVLNAGDGTVGMFRIGHDGELMHLGDVEGLPTPYAQGIAAY